MRRSMLCVMLVALIVGMATTAGAYDRVYSWDYAATHDQGTFGVNGAFYYLWATSAYDADGNKSDWNNNAKNTHMWIPIDIYYSVTDQLEIWVQPQFSMEKWTADGSDDMSGSGIGDTWIKVKYWVMPEPAVAFRAGVKVATGNDEPDAGDLWTGTGQMDIDGAFLFGVPAGPGTFDAAVGYRMRMENSDADWKPGNEIHFVAGYTYWTSEAMSLGLAAEGYFGSDQEQGGTALDNSGANIVYVAPCFNYMMDTGLSMGANFYYPLMGTNTEADWGFGILFGWGA